MEVFKEECNASVTGVPYGFSCDKTFPEEALKRILKAKEYFKACSYELAVYDLEYARKKYDEYYGKLANECGEVYYALGEALYLLSLKEKFRSKKEKNKAEEDRKEKELSESTDSPHAVVVEGSTDTKVQVETSEFMKEAGFSPQEVSLDDNLSKICLTDEHSVAKESKMEEGKIITNQWLSDNHLKLALKFLEDAKLIFERQNTVEAELKLAETLQLFGNIFLNGDNYSSAIQEYKRSEKIYEKHLKPGDKILTDLYIDMSVLYRKAQMYPEALKYFQNTIRMLEMERENLRNTKVDADGTFKHEVQNHISDLCTLIQGIKGVIKDIEKLMNIKKEMVET